jgi:protein SCO1/2
VVRAVRPPRRRAAHAPAWAAAVLALAGLASSGCGGDSAGGSVSGGQGSELARAADDDWSGPQVADFAMLERSGRSVRRADLAGRTLVLDFIFTTCAGPCPALSAGLAELQRELADSDVLLVSVSVDPKNDTLERLGEYAQRFGAEPERWLFLRGEPAELAALARSVTLSLQDDPSAQPGFQVTHSTKLLVIDGTGHVRGYYDGLAPDERGRAAARARWLASR